MSSESEPHLLVVDDDTRLRDLLRRYLSDNGFRVTIAADAEEARSNLASFAFDLVVLDVMMPGENGLDLTRALRREGRHSSPVADRDGGAGGPGQRSRTRRRRLPFKPFEPRELVLRIRNLLQRRPAVAAGARDVRFGGYRFDLLRGELYRGGDVVHLTAAESGLLSVLAEKIGQVLSREDLSLSFSGNVRNVDVQMTRLRRKIERDPRYPRYLQTVRGTGYVLRPD